MKMDTAGSCVGVGVGGCMSEHLCMMKIRSDRQWMWGYVTNRENCKKRQSAKV